MLLQLVKVIMNHFGDIIGVAGLVVSVVGFILTLIAVRRAKTAAQTASEAVIQLRSQLVQMDTIAELAAVINIMEETKRLHRIPAWHVLIERYGTIRVKLVTIRTGNPAFSDTSKALLVGATKHFATMELKVEKYLQSKAPGPPSRSEEINAAKFNEIISEQIERIAELLSEVKQQSGGK